MKLRTTTPASVSFIGKLSLVFFAVLLAIAGPLQLANTVFADQYDDKMRAIQSEINAFQAEAATLNSQAQTLQTELARLTSERATIQAQIDLSQLKYDQLVAKIAETEKTLQDNQGALGDILAGLYTAGNISPLEMLASSKNISEYLDKQQYRSSVRDELSSTINEVNALKIQLGQQKAEVEKVLAEQKGQKDILVQKENEQADLLAQTRGQESAYQSLAASKRNELAAVQQQQREAIARLTNNGKNTAGAVGSFQFRNFSGNQGSCGGGYPSGWCSAPLDEYVDEWALYTRECVSYAAWAAEYRFSKHVTSFSGMGNAYQWPNTASSLMGASVDNSPTVGSVAIAPRSSFTPIGHAMVVEQVYGDGWIRVSQYNFAGTGEYSTMDLLASSAVYVHFLNK
ncbi:MAG: exported protein of unknown function [Candidatus Saccharibacteria bacterium]|nr:exported protein of unknown function [Candidatus Saccharibacteria bacterium]